MVNKDDNYCRLCLNVKNKLTSVFDEDKDINKYMAKYIHIFFVVEVKRDDTLSTSICQNCLDFIITIIRQRVKFRENDKVLTENNRINLSVGEKIDPTDLQTKGEREDPQKKSTVVHPSVKRMLKASKNIVLARDLWHFNYDARVDLKIPPNPWPRRNKENTSHSRQKSKRRIQNHQKRKLKYMNDPDYTSYVQSLPSTSTFMEDTESEVELGAVFASSFNTAGSVKRSKRSCKTPERFGETLVYEQFGVDTLEEILPVQSECESIYTNNMNPSKTKFKRKITKDNTSEPVALPDSYTPKYLSTSIDESLVNNSIDFLPNSFNSAVRNTKRKYVKQIDVNSKFKSQNSKQFQDSDSIINEEEITNSKPVECSEDNWNKFFNNYYERPELPDTALYDEDNRCSLLLITGPEKPVFLCPLCEKVFDDEKSRKKHLLSHDNTPVLDIQKYDYFNYDNSQILTEGAPLIC